MFRRGPAASTIFTTSLSRIGGLVVPQGVGSTPVKGLLAACLPTSQCLPTTAGRHISKSGAVLGENLNSSCCRGNQQTDGCCGGEEQATTKKQPADAEITDLVRDGYAAVSKRTTEGRTDADKVAADKVAEGMGYSAEELASVPGEANMGLQCGNPTKTAGLKPGEVVVDLGSGGGIDVFLAAKQVGPTGKAIGVDMTTEMIEQARASAKAAGITNVEFVQSNITEINLPDNTADVIISNCVINLAPNKMDVFKEMFRVLKPGGRVAVSDVVLTTKEMPPSIRSSVTLLVGCVSGAITEAAYTEGLVANGFESVAVVPGGQDLNAMWHPEKQSKSANDCAACTTTCCGVTCDDVQLSELQQFDINQYVFSGKVTGVKPLAAASAEKKE